MAGRTQSRETGRRKQGGARTLPRWLWLMALIVFPAIVALHGWRTLNMLDAQRDLYLRNRIAMLAARLESLPESVGQGEPGDWVETFLEEEPSLLDVRVFQQDGSAPAAQAIFNGEELFRMEDAVSDGQPVFRAWIPFHRAGELRVARLDFDASAADFLTAYAYQSIALVAAIAAALTGLSLYAFRMAARTAALERRQAETAHLAKLGEMSAVLAHEIRNPLGSIKGFAQLIEERTSDDSRVFAGEIVEQSTRLERLVEDLLHYGRVPVPEIAPARWTDMVTAIRRRWPEAILAAPPAVHLHDADIDFHTDAGLLEQALLNLLRNAREAVSSSPSGSVSLQARQEGPDVLITVADNGPGLSEDARARLFEPFFTTKAFGTGLGLATTQKIVKALGGALELRNHHPAGLRATIRLPLVSRGKEP